MFFFLQNFLQKICEDRRKICLWYGYANFRHAHGDVYIIANFPNISLPTREIYIRRIRCDLCAAFATCNYLSSR